MQMKSRFYRGKGIQRDEGASDLPAPRNKALLAPEKYLADDGLIDAANVALMLGQPLLLTGEAGTGKTQFAYSLAWELKLGEPLKFETKSNSVARDLFYTYDALKRFQDVQSGLRPQSIFPYLAYQALGHIRHWALQSYAHAPGKTTRIWLGMIFKSRKTQLAQLC
jgi:hypothetical protein